MVIYPEVVSPSSNKGGKVARFLLGLEIYGSAGIGVWSELR